MGKPTLVLSASPITNSDGDAIADFISAMLNEGTYDPLAHGISNEDIYAHQRVHEFALEYQERTGHAPTPDQVTRKFADFPYSPEAETSWCGHEAFEAVRSRTLRIGLSKAAQELIDGSSDGAIQILEELLDAIPVESGKPLDASDASIYFEPPVPVCPVAGQINKIAGGIGAGQVWFVCARPGMGKTWDLIRHAIKAIESGWDVDFFSLEMSARMIMKRLHSVMVGLDDDPQVMKSTVEEWFAQPGRGTLRVLDTSMINGSLSDIKRLARPNTLILIDYVSLISTPPSLSRLDQHERVERICKQLQQISVRLSVPIIAAVQLNRQAEAPKGSASQRLRGNAGFELGGPPSLSDIAESDAPAKVGDLVYFIRARRGSRVREYRVLKHRHGPDGQVFYVDFRPTHSVFAEISSERARSIMDTETIQTVEL